TLLTNLPWALGILIFAWLVPRPAILVASVLCFVVALLSTPKAHEGCVNGAPLPRWALVVLILELIFLVLPVFEVFRLFQGRSLLDQNALPRVYVTRDVTRARAGAWYIITPLVKSKPWAVVQCVQRPSGLEFIWAESETSGGILKADGFSGEIEEVLFLFGPSALFGGEVPAPATGLLREERP
ncbi:MAG: hypothetical protein KDB07_00715, partial [Planctomycetes bacterium]|nr:hypothetical protein [Planctomycetota bacterium]